MQKNKTASHLLLLIIYSLISGCSSTPETESVVTPTPARQPKAVAYALTLQGVPYRYGKDNPREGFDCSGFVRHVYSTQGVRLPRTAREMALTLPAIPKYAMQSGDLVFFNINGQLFSHVGIYINGNQFIHAPSQRTGKVLVSNLTTDYWQQHFSGIRRPKLLISK